MKTSDRFLEGLRLIATSVQHAEPEMLKGVREVARAMSERSKAFQQKQANIKKDMDRGARLTDHRIPL